MHVLCVCLCLWWWWWWWWCYTSCVLDVCPVSVMMMMMMMMMMANCYIHCDRREYQVRRAVCEASCESNMEEPKAVHWDSDAGTFASFFPTIWAVMTWNVRVSVWKCLTAGHWYYTQVLHCHHRHTDTQTHTHTHTVHFHTTEMPRLPVVFLPMVGRGQLCSYVIVIWSPQAPGIPILSLMNAILNRPEQKHHWK